MWEKEIVYSLVLSWVKQTNKKFRYIFWTHINSEEVGTSTNGNVKKRKGAGYKKKLVLGIRMLEEKFVLHTILDLFYYLLCSTSVWTQGHAISPIFVMGFFKTVSFELFTLAGFDPDLCLLSS
jgi:hypothetical protein